MSLARTLNHLAGYLQEELGARRRTLELLEQQEAGIKANDPKASAQALADLEREMTLNAARNRRREKLMGELSKIWGVPQDLLTLGSVIERGGEATAQLAPMRAELRDATAAVIRKNRLLGALIGMHRRVIKDVIEYVLEDEHGAVMSGSGSLIDAEA